MWWFHKIWITQKLNFSWCWKINCLGSRVIRTTWVETIPESEMFLLVMHKHGMLIGHFGICRTFSMPFSNVKLGLVCQIGSKITSRTRRTRSENIYIRCYILCYTFECVFGCKSVYSHPTWDQKRLQKVSRLVLK